MSRESKGRDSGAAATGTQARYIMVGGFLGAGKTTAIARLARHLKGKNYRIGLITNDQSRGLADTAILRSQGYAVEEVAGGCFCCRFDSLTEAADKLSEQDRPDVFVAEPVGSCTDLVATVSYPLRRMYGNRYSVAPLSVVLDCTRAARMFDLVSGRNFSPEVRYVYQKQIEEADIILLNKIDVIDESLLGRLLEWLADRHPQARVIPCSATREMNLTPWFEELEGNQFSRQPPLEIDYDLYARGEAALGWLNATLRLTGAAGIDGNELVQEFCARIQSRLVESGSVIAHLKMTLDPGFPSGEIVVVSVVRNETVPELRASLLGRVVEGQLILNLRAEASPQRLEAFARRVIDEMSVSFGLNLAVEHLESFRPAAPQPQYRLLQEDAPATMAGRD